ARPRRQAHTRGVCILGGLARTHLPILRSGGNQLQIRRPRRARPLSQRTAARPDAGPPRAAAARAQEGEAARLSCPPRRPQRGNRGSSDPVPRNIPLDLLITRRLYITQPSINHEVSIP